MNIKDLSQIPKINFFTKKKNLKISEILIAIGIFCRQNMHTLQKKGGAYIYIYIYEIK